MCDFQIWEKGDAEELRRIGERSWGDVDKVSLILERAGWSVAEIPRGISMGRDFWTIVVRELLSGVAPGFCAVISVLLDEFPLNAELRALAWKVGHGPRRSMLDGLTEGVADLLTGVSSVGAIADSLRVRETRDGEALRMAVARRLFAEEVGLRSVASAFSGSAASAATKVEIADRVVPFKGTVPHGAAWQLAPLLRPDDAGNAASAAVVVGVRAKATPLAYWYLINASCRSDRTDLPVTVDLMAGGEPGGVHTDLAAAIRRELLEIVGYLPGDAEPDAAQLDVLIGWIEDVHRRRVAVLLDSPWHPDVIDYLCREFPRLVFVVLTASESHPAGDPMGLLLLDPILDPHDENRFYWYYRAMTGRAPRSSAARSSP